MRIRKRLKALQNVINIIKDRAIPFFLLVLYLHIDPVGLGGPRMEHGRSTKEVVSLLWTTIAVALCVFKEGDSSVSQWEGAGRDVW